MHEYTVEFRIHGEELDPAAVSKTLKLEPALVREVGERRDSKSVWEQALWSYTGFAGPEGSKSWDTLEEGLNFVLDKLWSHQETINTYKDRYKVILWCSHFQSSLDGGPTFSPAILKRLSEFGIELYLDNYFSDDSTENIS